ncbi:SPOR domain-containing protein [Maridesulfovibrio sp. FT414]|uniref:SPOR domain-containing protein n=1 Tax=Maridesulfovibrio sp. FT414 TaxID=2979469 RepID=UPI003D803E90
MKKLTFILILFLTVAAAQLVLIPVRSSAQDSPVAGPDKDGKIWTVRVSAFDQAENTWNFVSYLEKEGFKPTVVRLFDSKGKLWRVVQIGDYPTKSQASIVGLVFRKRVGLDYMVRSMSRTLLDERTASTKETPLPVNPMAAPVSGGIGRTDGIKAGTGTPSRPAEELLKGTSEEFFYELDQRDVLRAVSERQRSVIMARIMIRRGYINDGLRMYEKLLKQYPTDFDLREEYIEVLLDNDEYEKAAVLLKAWLQDEPLSAGALRQEARLRLLTGDFDQQQATLGYLLRLRPGDIESISARAYGRQEAGDWLGAVTGFSELIDKEPDNVDAREALAGILLQRRPRLELTPSIYLQPNDTITTTLGGSFAMQLNELTRGEVYYANTNIYRPAGEGIDKIDKDVNQLAFIFKRELSRTFTGVAGIGVHEGTASGFSGTLGFDWQVHRPGLLSAMIDYNNPWLDEPSAANYKGRYNQLALTYNGFYDDTWGLFLNGQYRQYTLDEDRLYGHRGVLNVILTRRLLSDPDLFVSYSFYRSKFKYEDSTYTPVEIVPNEAIHTISASFSKSLCDVISIEGSGGVRADEFKTSLSYFGGPSLVLRLGRFELSTGYEYSSDSGQVGGGETQLIRGGFSFVF